MMFQEFLDGYGEMSEDDLDLANQAYLAGCEHGKKHAKAVAVAKPKKADSDEIDCCFDRFWDSGIRKSNKKKARLAFARVISGSPAPATFTVTLCRDIAARIQADQLGFTEMLPTTYLNGERWEDEIKPREDVHTPLFDCFGAATTAAADDTLDFMRGISKDRDPPAGEVQGRLTLEHQP